MSSNNKKRISAAKDTKGTVKRLLGYLSAYKIRFIFVVICIAILPQQLLTPLCLSRI